MRLPLFESASVHIYKAPRECKRCDFCHRTMNTDVCPPDRNDCSSPHLPVPDMTCQFPVPISSQALSPSGGSCQPLSSRPLARSNTPSPLSTLDTDAVGSIDPPEGSASEKLVNISQQVLDTLRNSNIVEKRTNDSRTQFWTAYQRVATEYDNEFLERHNGDMDIVFIFSALFSGVNTTFIVSMGPSPASTTDALLTHIITLMVMKSQGISIENNFPFSLPPAYPSGQVWFQTLAYASLSFSLLAAFGAVLGKQWLRFYKLERFGHRSLEERGRSRQQKFDGLQAWQLDAILQMFPILLQISLLLFGISLSSFVWTQQRTITSVIIATTGLGSLFYILTLLASLLFPVCPFQTPASLILRMVGALICTGSKFIKTNDNDLRSLSARLLSFRSIKKSTPSPRQQWLNPKSSSDPTAESAVRWLLATSTDPDSIAAAAALIPTITWPPDSDIASYCQRLRDTFVDCFETDGRLWPSAEDRAVSCGRALNHLCLAGILNGHECNNRTASQQLRILQQWRRIILPREFDQCKALACQLPTLSGYDKQKYQADTRSALRMMIAAAGDGFIHPNDDSVIWRGRFTWSKDPRTAADFDWLVDYLVSCPKDQEVRGDALLALSAMNGLGSNDRTSAYLEALVSAMKSNNPRLRYAALRAVLDSRMALADLNAIEDETILDLLLTKLSPTLLTVVRPDSWGEAYHNFSYWRDDAYQRVVVALTSNERWCTQLLADGHVEHCIFTLHNLGKDSPASFHLAAIFGRVHAICPYAPEFDAVTEAQFSSLAQLAWQSVLTFKLYDEDECIRALPVVVNFTRQLQAISAADLQDIRRNVGLTRDKLKRRNKDPEIVSALQSYYTALTH